MKIECLSERYATEFLEGGVYEVVSEERGYWTVVNEQDEEVVLAKNFFRFATVEE